MQCIITEKQSNKSKYVRMVRKYHNHKLQTNPLECLQVPAALVAFLWTPNTYNNIKSTYLDETK